MGILFNILITIGNIIFGSFVFSALWDWYIVPMGAVAMSVPMAFGFLLIVTFIQIRFRQNLKSEFLIQGTYRQKLGNLIFMNTTALLIGFLGSLFL